MGGGSLQLSAIGKENNYLTINPQISFFKAVYKKYSNFAMQSIRINFDTIDKLSYNEDTKLKLKLPKNAELINSMFFEIKLPKLLVNEHTDGEQFYWIKNLGSVIVKSARILIGGEVIEDYDSEYMYIYNNNYINNEKNKLYNELVGNTKDKFEPVLNDNYRYSGDKNTYDTTATATHYNKNYNNIPTINNDILRIPLPFWFHRNIGLSLPIFMLEYDDVIIELVLRPIRDLCMIITKTNQTTPLSFIPAKKESDETTLTTNGLSTSIYHNKLEKPSTTESSITKHFENNRWDLQPHLDINYIFLSENDKQLF